MNQRIHMKTEKISFIFCPKPGSVGGGGCTHIRTLRTHQGNPEDSVLRGGEIKTENMEHFALSFVLAQFYERKAALFDRDSLFAMNKHLLVMWVATSHNDTHPSGCSFTSPLLHDKKCPNLF